jgi:hypothetical protein
MNKHIVGTVADAIETPFGKTDKILGGAGSRCPQLLIEPSAIVSVVGDDFPYGIEIWIYRWKEISIFLAQLRRKTFSGVGRYQRFKLRYFRQSN